MGSGARPVWTAPAVAGTLYLAVVISALGYVAWDWALARLPAPRAAVFLNVQPIAGALLGPLLLDEPLTGFTIAGVVAIVGASPLLSVAGPVYGVLEGLAQR